MRHLPDELWFQVWEYLPPADVHLVAATNRHLRQYCQGHGQRWPLPLLRPDVSADMLRRLRRRGFHHVHVRLPEPADHERPSTWGDTAPMIVSADTDTLTNHEFMDWRELSALQVCRLRCPDQVFGTWLLRHQDVFAQLRLLQVKYLADATILPPGLLELDASVMDCHRVKLVQWPPQLRRLRVGTLHGPLHGPLPRLPATLEDLAIGFGWKTWDLFEGPLPENLRHLAMSDLFQDRSFAGRLPTTLVSLRMGQHYATSLFEWPVPEPEAGTVTADPTAGLPDPPGYARHWSDLRQLRELRVAMWQGGVPRGRPPPALRVLVLADVGHSEVWHLTWQAWLRAAPRTLERLEVAIGPTFVQLPRQRPLPVSQRVLDLPTVSTLALRGVRQAWLPVAWPGQLRVLDLQLTQVLSQSLPVWPAALEELHLAIVDNPCEVWISTLMADTGLSRLAHLHTVRLSGVFKWDVLPTVPATLRHLTLAADRGSARCPLALLPRHLRTLSLGPAFEHVPMMDLPWTLEELHLPATYNVPLPRDLPENLRVVYVDKPRGPPVRIYSALHTSQQASQ